MCLAANTPALVWYAIELSIRDLSWQTVVETVSLLPTMHSE
jgi:hypothetical protein